MEYINKEGEELIKAICNFLSDALEDALEEVEEKEILEDVNPILIAQKHLAKRLSYIESEGWLDDEEVSS